MTAIALDESVSKAIALNTIRVNLKEWVPKFVD
jgi:hypothetical protein